MAQFKIYNSADSGSPVLMGASGSLINLLDQCLVYGYPNHPPAGWLKPIANTTNPHCGCWQQPSGSGCVLYCNDAAAYAANNTVTQAWITGWDSITNITPPCGTGSGQFPAFGQILVTGHLVARKSATADSSSRAWILFADDRTLYLFMNHAGTAYNGVFFGDIYSYKLTPDTLKCFIHGRYTENDNTATGDTSDQIVGLAGTTAQGSYITKPMGNLGLSTIANRVSNVFQGGTSNTAMVGFLQTPNSVDNSLYILPVLISEATTVNIRGRMRGMYVLCHPAANFGDGQIIQGANEYAGKTLMVIKPGNNAGMWLIETSDTLDTN